jgi:CHASE2 domain-containing sensor protein
MAIFANRNAHAFTLVALFSALALPANANPQVETLPFRLVMIDAATEAKLGAFPIDRAHVAKAVDILTTAGAKVIVLKFFYDLPSTPSSDAALQNALSKSTVVLQARIDESEPKPNSLPSRFFMPHSDATASISGNSGWIPLPNLANAAAAIGFADTTDVNVVPAILRYQSKTVSSLTIATIQAALNNVSVQLQSGKFFHFGKHRLALNDKNQILLSANALDEKSSVNKIQVLSFIDLLNGNFLPADIKGKVIVLGYDGNKSPVLKTRFGETKVHRVFYLGLIDAWRQLQAE